MAGRKITTIEGLEGKAAEAVREAGRSDDEAEPPDLSSEEGRRGHLRALPGPFDE